MNHITPNYAAYHPIHISPIENAFFDTSPVIPVEMLLDTGASASCIPEAAIIEIESVIGQSLPYRSIKVRSFDGIVTPQRLYKLKLANTDFSHSGSHDFIAIQNEVGIVGRDLLNQNTILFDGPSSQWWFYNMGRTLSIVRFLTKILHSKPYTFRSLR